MNAKTISKNTHQLATGDVLKHYGATLKLTERRVFQNPDQPENETIQFDTECLHLEEGAAMPQHWVNRPGGFSIQGNNRAIWAVVAPE